MYFPKVIVIESMLQQLRTKESCVFFKRNAAKYQKSTDSIETTSNWIEIVK